MLHLKQNASSRRQFFKHASNVALTGLAFPSVLNLAAIGNAAAFSATDYKALVCVFLAGGNDYANTVVTYDNESYDRYRAIRPDVALSKTALEGTLLKPSVPLPGGRQYALHPSLAGLSSLFNNGMAAVQLNVGPLIVPLTRAQYASGNRLSYPVPPKLFSHNDQASVWQSSQPEGATSGWGGRIGDLALSNNGTSVLTCISASGNATYLYGNDALSYQVSTSGPVAINSINQSVYGSSHVRSGISQLIQQPSAHVIEGEYTRVVKRAIATEATVRSGIATIQSLAAFPSTLDSNSLAMQLKIVARLIGARNMLGVKRQVFFVSVGGYDLHDRLIQGHSANMSNLDAALSAFYAATVELGVADKVTAFTASDFGRTLVCNGDGSDHGWGGHHFIVGGAVKGNAFYGKAPPVSVNNSSDAYDQWHVGKGVLLPSTSVDQYAGTLARWFGVSDTELSAILPNLVNFTGVEYPRNLGFML